MAPYQATYLYTLARQSDENELPFVLLGIRKRTNYLYPRAGVAELILLQDRFKEGQPENRKRHLRERRPEVEREKYGPHTRNFPGNKERKIDDMYTIAMYNQKGGVGKTTCSVGLAEQFTLMGLSVLLIDADTQGNATSHLGIEQKNLRDEHYFFKALADHAGLLPIIQTESDVYLGPMVKKATWGVQSRLCGDDQRFLLREALRRLPKPFDMVIVDCPPSTPEEGHVWQTLNAADGIIFPIETEVPAFKNLVDVKRLIGEKIDEGRKASGFPPVSYLGILPAIYDLRIKSHDLVIQKLPEIATRLGVPVLPGVKHNTVIKEAMAHETTLERFQPTTTTQRQSKRDGVRQFEDLAVAVGLQLGMNVIEEEESA